MKNPAVPTIEASLKTLHRMVSEFENKEITTDKHDLWSVKKLIVLRYYLYPFLQILRKNGYRKIHYVDLFSGSGLLKIKNKIMPGTSLIPLLTTAELVEKHPNHFFDYVHLSDSYRSYCDLLRNRISKLDLSLSTEIDITHRSFDESVKSIFSGKAPEHKDQKENAYLVVLDPYGFQVDWSNLKRILQSGAVDLIIIFHTRLIRWNHDKIQSKSALTSMFGNEDWLDCRTEDDFIKLYCKRIESIPVTWKQFKTKILTVPRDTGKYHLICASRSPGATNVFNDIQTRFDSVDNKLLTKIFDTSLGDQSKMDGFFK